MLFLFVLMSMGVSLAVGASKSLRETCTDEELIQRYAQGDMRAFEILYTRHRKPLFNFILRFVRPQGSPNDAEELLQEVFMRVVRNANEYVQKAKFTTWMYTIARNRCIDFLRRRQTTPSGTSMDQSLGHEDEGGQTLKDRLEDESNVDGNQRVFRQQFQTILKQGIETLPDDQREVFLLREFSSLPYKEIAEIVDVVENTVKSRMRYALEGLRKFFVAHGFSLEDIE